MLKLFYNAMLFCVLNLAYVILGTKFGTQYNIMPNF